MIHHVLGIFGGLVLLVALSVPVLEHVTKYEYPVAAGPGVVVVTGASTGIGLHAAEQLAFAQNHTVLAGVRSDASADKLRALQAEWKKEHPNAVGELRPVFLDVTEQDSIDAVLAAAEEEIAATGKPLIGIVNNAGIAYSLPIELSDMERFEKVMDTNLFGVVRMMKTFLPMLRKHTGRIVSISSIAGLYAKPTCGSYCASKHALEAISDAARGELRFYNVSVSVVQPCAVRSAIWDKNTGKNSQLSQLSDEDRALYAHVYNGSSESVKRLVELADEPTVTSEAIVHALHDKHPKTRYLVANAWGVPCWVLERFATLVPDRIRDHVLGRAM